jgi:F-type H+-transporting ATPase subunit b
MVFLVTESDELTGRIFGLDPQLLADSAILALSVFVLFLALSYLLFNPARNLLEKRREKVKQELDVSTTEKEKAISLRQEYEEKLKNTQNEVDEILSLARKNALKKEETIIAEARLEANRFINIAKKEIELEKEKVKEDVKNEMITVAAFIAGKLIEASLDNNKQNKIIEDAINEMGESTWLN